MDVSTFIKNAEVTSNTSSSILNETFVKTCTYYSSFNGSIKQIRVVHKVHKCRARSWCCKMKMNKREFDIFYNNKVYNAYDQGNIFCILFRRNVNTRERVQTMQSILHVTKDNKIHCSIDVILMTAKQLVILAV